jgi:hypothetical protein
VGLEVEVVVEVAFRAVESRELMAVRYLRFLRRLALLVARHSSCRPLRVLPRVRGKGFHMLKPTRYALGDDLDGRIRHP